MLPSRPEGQSESPGEMQNPAAGSLSPRSPADMADLYAMVHDDVSSHVAGAANASTLKSLALLGVRSLAGHELLRCLIVGEPGTGKTTVVRQLAHTLGLPFLRVSMPDTPETTWGGGADLLDQVAALVRALPESGPESARRAGHMVLLIDDLDIVRLEPWVAHGASDRGQREGRQRSLLSVWSGDTLPIGDDYSWRWDTRRVLVIACMEGDGLPDTVVGAADLVRWGFLAPLADRIAMGAVLRMHPVSRTEATDLLVRETERLAAPAFEAFGYRLTVSPAAARYVLVSLEKADAGVRSLVGVLRDAADAALIELVTSAAPVGTERVLGPDDVQVIKPRIKGP
jgi:hypothetical protein